MIGIFDSGFGVLQTLKYFQEVYSQYDYLFLADSKNVPYGEKSAAEIKKMTFAGLNWLFDNGAEIVVLACNTAAAYSVKIWQLEFPEKKVLSITIPGVEKVQELGCKNIGALMTQATFDSGIYIDLCYKFLDGKKYNIESVVAGDIVFSIENRDLSSFDRQKIIKKYLNQFENKLDCLILGCTHYPIWMKDFRLIFDGEIVDPNWESVLKMEEYFSRHEEIFSRIPKQGKIRICVTGNVDKFKLFASRIYGNLNCERIVL